MSLEWYQGSEPETGLYAKIRDCWNEGNGETYFAKLPRLMPTPAIIEDYRSTADYDGPCACCLFVYDGNKGLIRCEFTA